MSVVRVRGAGYDDAGDPIEGTPARRPLPEAFWAPAETGDINDRGRAGDTEARTLYDPANTQLLSTDQVEIDGVLFDVNGVAGRWVHPWSDWTPGTVTALVRAAG